MSEMKHTPGLWEPVRGGRSRWYVGRELAPGSMQGLRDFLFTKSVNIRRFGSLQAAQKVADRENAALSKAAPKGEERKNG